MTTIRVRIAGIAIAFLSIAAISCAGAAPASETPAAASPTVVPATPAPSPTFAGQVIDIGAKDSLFSLTEFEVAAGAAFEIRFENQDPFNHAVYIVVGALRPEDTSDEALVANSAFRGDYIAGPVTITYHVAALPPGTYHFFCPPHVPMSGTIEVRYP